MWGILIAIASGALMSIQGVWNTQLSRAGSTWLASSYVPVSYTHLPLSIYHFSMQQ